MPKTGFFGQKPVSRGLGSPSHIFFEKIFFLQIYIELYIIRRILMRWFQICPYFWDEVPKNTKKPQKTFQKPYGFEILITPDPEVWASLGIYTSTRHMLENISWKFQLERTLAKISALTILNTSLVHVHAKIFSIIFSLEKWLKRKIFFINRKLRCSAFIIY